MLQKKAVKGRTDLQEESDEDPEIRKSTALMEETAEIGRASCRERV